MKVFLVHTGFFWSSIDISRGVERALKRLGCDVVSFDPKDGLRLFRSLTEQAAANGLRSANDMTLRLVCERIPLRVIEEKPDLFLVIHGGRLPSNVVRAVRELGVPTAVWLLDDPHEIDLSSIYAREYDFVFTDESCAVEAHRKAGARHVRHIPLGCSPDMQHPREVAAKYRSDICIVGSGFRERVELLTEASPALLKFNMKIIGPWPLPEDSPLAPVLVNKVVSAEEAARYCAGAKIVLNPHRLPGGSEMASNLWRVPAASPNPRLFEAAACGAFVLNDDKRADVGKYFEIGREMDVFANAGELAEKAAWWLGHEEARAAGAASASLRARNLHSLDVRMADLLAETGFPAPAARKEVALCL